MSRVLDDAPPFIVCSPEVLPNLYALLRNRGVSICMLVVDEAHCAFEWGTSAFRPRCLHRSTALTHCRCTNATNACVDGHTPCLRRGFIKRETCVIHRLPVRRHNVNVRVLRKRGIAADMKYIADTISEDFRNGLASVIIYRISRLDV